ncbi:MAG: hypothetical protein Q9168_005395 [Polycauliona sp. 1 TL-2023]
MSRPQDVYFDYNARQQYLRDRSRAPSRRPKRRWPPLPRAEDEIIALAQEFKPGPPDVGGKEARSRGALDQQPIILDADPHALPPRPPPSSRPSREKEHRQRYNARREASTSSDESSGPETPVDSDSEEETRNRDQRYIFIPQEGVEIPLTYDEPRTPIHGKPPQHRARVNPERGRVPVPKLDTDLPRAKSSHDAPVRLERERSPYRSVPKQRETPVHGDFLLSPEAMTPKPKFHDTHSHHTSQSQRIPMTAIHNLEERRQDSPQMVTRPSMPRQRSAMAYPGEGAAAMLSPTHNALRQDNATFPSRENQRLEPQTPISPRRSSALPSPTLSSQTLPHHAHVRQSSVPPPRALPASTDKTRAPAAPLSGFPGQQSLNAMLASPFLERRRASPRNSPSSSPLSSPPRTPPTETSNRKFGYIDSTKTSGPTSKPDSPLHPSQDKYPEHLQEVNPDQRRVRPTIRSRQTSPLPPSLPTGRLEANPAPRIDIRSPSPAVRNRSSSHSDGNERLRSQRPAPAMESSSNRVQTETLRPSNLEHRRRSSSAVDTRPSLTIDSSRAQEVLETAKPRHLSLKSPTATRAASVGAPPATLPPCPRSVPVGGHNDWYMLYDYPEFKICPSCRKAVSEAGYGRHLTAAFTNNPERPVRCTFSIPWIRMAYLLMIKKRRSDVNLLYDMADVARETDPCPGKRPSTRNWYRIYDVDSDRSVPGFYACPYCVRSLETIFPVLKDVFHKTRANSRHSLDPNTCSLRSDSSRFATYVDLLEDTANQANEYRRAPNTYRFVELAKTMGAIPPCSRDAMLRSKTWHFIPQLPEFTACPECYEEIIYPAILSGLPLATQFTKTPSQVTTGKATQAGLVSCQLYSRRMRTVFKDACEDDDFDYLRRVSVKRYRVERELQGRIVEAQAMMGSGEREEVMEEIVDEWADWD